MNFQDFMKIQTRRSFLTECAGGIGAIGLWQLMASEGRTTALGASLPDVNPLKPKSPQFAPKAKNVIFIFMEGAPSHLDLFDPKPEMKKWDGQPLPESMTKNLKLAFIKPNAKVWASPREFKTVWAEWHRVFGLHAQPGYLCGRYLHDPLHVY